MTADMDWKYTDADVRSREDLMAAAVAYARKYTGDWKFLVTARVYATETGSLPVAVARGVLNCMRHDISVVHQMPKPDRGENIRSDRWEEMRKINRQGCNLKHSFKAQFAYSPRPGIQVYHYLSQVKSRVVWRPDWEKSAGGKLVVEVRPVCAKYTPLIAALEPPKGLRLCAGCRSYADRQATQ